MIRILKELWKNAILRQYETSGTDEVQNLDEEDHLFLDRRGSL